MDNKYTILVSADIDTENSIAKINKTLESIRPNLLLELTKVTLAKEGIASLRKSIQDAIDGMNVTVNIKGAKVKKEKASSSSVEEESSEIPSKRTRTRVGPLPIPDDSFINIESIRQEIISKLGPEVQVSINRAFSETGQAYVKSIVGTLKGANGEVEKLTYGWKEVSIEGERQLQWQLLSENLVKNQITELKNVKKLREDITKAVQRVSEIEAKTQGKSKYSKEVSDVKITAQRVRQEAEILQNLLQSEGNVTEKVREQVNVFNKAVEQAKTAGAAMSAQGKNIQSWGTEIGVAIKRTLEWASAMTLLYGSLRQIQAGIAYISELDAQMTNIQVVANLTNKEIDDLALSYNRLAMQMGTTTSEVAAGSLEFIRQGKSVEETNKLLKLSLMMSKLAALDSAQSTEYLTTIMNGFNISAKDMGLVLDKLVALDNSYSTSVGEIAGAMQKSSVSAQQAGVSLDELASYITVVSSVTNDSAESIGTAFKSIFARMTAVKLKQPFDEMGQSISNVSEVLSKFNIDLIDPLTKDFRPMGDVLEDVAKKWNTLKATEQSQIAEALAGTYQREKLLVLLTNYNKVLEAQNIETTALGTAQDRYAIALNGVEAAQKRLTTAWEGLWQKTLSSGAIEKVYDSLAKILQVVDSLGGLIPIFSAISGIYVTINSIKISEFIGDFGKNLSEIAKGFGMLQNSAKTAEQAISSVTAASNTNSLALAANNVQKEEHIVLSNGQIVSSTGLAKSTQKETVETEVNSVAQEINNVQKEVGTVATTALSTAMAGLGIAIAAASIGYMVYANAQQKAKEKQDELNNSIAQQKDNLDELSSSGVQELISSYEELKIKVGQNYEVQANLTEEQDRFYQVQKKLHELLPTVAGHYDAMGRFILDEATNTQILTQAINDEIEAKKKKLDIDIQTRSISLVEDYKTLLNEMPKLIEDKKKAEAALSTSGVTGMGGYVDKVTLQKNLSESNGLIEEANVKIKEIQRQTLEDSAMASKDTQKIILDAWTYALLNANDESKSVIDDFVKTLQNSISGVTPKIADSLEPTQLEADYQSILSVVSDFYNKQHQMDNEYTEEVIRNAMARAMAIGDTAAYDKLKYYLDNIILVNQEIHGEFMQTVEAENATMEALSQSIFQQAASANMSLYDMQGNVINSANGVYAALTSSTLSFSSFVTMLAKATGKTATDIRDIFAKFATEMSQYVSKQVPFAPTAPTIFPSIGGGGSGENALKKANDAKIKQLEKEKNALQDRSKEYNQYIDTLKEELKLQKEEKAYLDDLADKNKKLAKLKTDIEILALDNSEEAKRKRLELEQSASDLENEITKDKEDRKYQVQIDALDKLKKDFEDSINSQISKLEEQISLLNEESNSVSSVGGAYSSMGGVAVATLDTISGKLRNISSLNNFQISQLQIMIAKWNDLGYSIVEITSLAQQYVDKMAEVSLRNELIRHPELESKDTTFTRHHSGGFAGNLQSNETFAKLLKGEYIATEGQMDNFMSNILPRLAGVQFSRNESSAGVSLSMPINVQGNLDSAVLPDIEKIANKVINSINSTMKSRGIIRRTDLVSI